jgi:hypothetical protein
LAATDETEATLAAKPKRSAASVIANTTKESADAWTKRARSSTPSEDEEDVGVSGAMSDIGVSTTADDNMKVEPQVAVAVAEARGDDELTRAVNDGDGLDPVSEAETLVQDVVEEQDTDEEDLEEVQPATRDPKSLSPAKEIEAQPVKRSLKLTLKAGPGVGAAPSVPTRKAPVRASKRKAISPVDAGNDSGDDLSALEDDEEEEEKPVGRSRRGATSRSNGKVAKIPAVKTRSNGRSRDHKTSAPQTPATTRSLRSRQPKSAEKVRAEKEAQARVKAALASDAEDEDDEEAADDVMLDDEEAED